MVQILKMIDAEPNYRRATWLCQHGVRWFFAILIQRENKAKLGSYWCLYVSLWQDEFALVEEFRKAREQKHFSFLGIASEHLMVPKKFTDAIGIDQPEHFVGKHFSVNQVFKEPEVMVEIEMFARLIFDITEPANALAQA